MITLMKNLKNAVADNARRARKTTEYVTDNTAFISENIIKIDCSSEVYQYDVVKIDEDGTAKLFTGNEKDEDNFVPVIVISGNGGNGEIHAQVSGWGYVHVSENSPSISAGDKLTISKSNKYSVTLSADDNSDAGDVDLFEAIEEVNASQNSVVKVKFLSGGGGESVVSTSAPVQLKSKVDYETYIGDVYANGKGEDATDVDATIKIVEIHTSATISTPIWFIATAKIGDIYYIDVPRFIGPISE